MSEFYGAVKAHHLTVQGQPALVHMGGVGREAILLLHGGWGGAHVHWSRVWGRLARGHRVIAPDLPGVGDPDQLGRLRLADYVSWLNDLLHLVDADRAYCIGNSWGASLAWSFAGRSPEHCLGVILVNGLPMPRTPSPLLWLGHRAIGRGLMRAMLNRRSFTPDALRRAFATPDNAPLELQTSLEHTPTRRIETFLDSVIEGDGAPTPRAPIMFLWGEADHLPGTGLAVGKALHAKYPMSRFVHLANAGHFPQIERPSAFAEAIEAFIAQHPPADQVGHGRPEFRPPAAAQRHAH